MYPFPRLTPVLLLVAFAASLNAATETQRLYLSGRDKDNTVPWRFFCTSGANFSGFRSYRNRSKDVGPDTEPATIHAPSRDHP